MSDPEGTYQQAIACATVVYHCGRMEAVRFIALHTTAHNLIFNRPGKRAITLWPSICHEKLQVSFQWSSLWRCEMELAYVWIPDDNNRLSLLPPHTVSVQNRLLLTSSQRIYLFSARVSRVQAASNWQIISKRFLSSGWLQTCGCGTMVTTSLYCRRSTWR